MVSMKCTRTGMDACLVPEAHISRKGLVEGSHMIIRRGTLSPKRMYTNGLNRSSRDARSHHNLGGG